MSAGRRAPARAAAIAVALFSSGCQNALELYTNPVTLCEGTSGGCGSQVCSSGECQDIGKIAAGGDTTCALLTDGTTWCWGLNANGESGQFHGTPEGGPWTPSPPMQVRPAPVPLPSAPVPLLHRVIDLAVGGDKESGHACALTELGEIWCWGDNRFSQAGEPHGGERWTSANRIELPPHVTPTGRIHAGHGRSCFTGEVSAEDPDRLWCWGLNDMGQVSPALHASSIPAPEPIGALRHVTGVALGRAHTCALADGQVLCWGDRAVLPCDAPGNGGGNDGMIEVPFAGVTVRGIAAGDRHTCASTDAGVFCWGASACSAEEGSACDAACGGPPLPLAGLEADLHDDRIAANADQTCVSFASGAVKCWKVGEDAQMAPVTSWSLGHGAGLGIADLACGRAHTCARPEDANLQCWGQNDHGQLGRGSASPDDMLFEPPGSVKWYQSSSE